MKMIEKLDGRDLRGNDDKKFFRCKKCNKLLDDIVYKKGVVEVRCGRCGNINKLK